MANPIIEELKKSFLVQECGLSLEEAAETYDEMDGETTYTDALKENQNSGNQD